MRKWINIRWRTGGELARPVQSMTVNNKNKLKRSLGEEVEEVEKVEEGSGPCIIRLVARFIYSAVSTIQTQQSEMRDEMVSAHSPCQSHPFDGRPFVQLSSSNL